MSAILSSEEVGGILKLGRTPLAEAHADAFRDAVATLQKLGVKPPSKADARKIVVGIAADAKRNGRGIVQREARRAAETVHRAVTSGTPPAEAARAAIDHEIRQGDFARATVDHVRATARATLAHAGESAGATRWLVALGPDEQRDLIDKSPTGQVAEIAWKTYTTEELDDLYRAANKDRSTWSSWRDLGLTFGSPELYVPLPVEALAAAAVIAAAAERRKKFDAERWARQGDLDRLPNGKFAKLAARVDALSGMVPERLRSIEEAAGGAAAALGQRLEAAVSGVAARAQEDFAAAHVVELEARRVAEEKRAAEVAEALAVARRQADALSRLGPEIADALDRKTAAALKSLQAGLRAIASGQVDSAAGIAAALDSVGSGLQKIAAGQDKATDKIADLAAGIGRVEKIAGAAKDFEITERADGSVGAVMRPQVS